MAKKKSGNKTNGGNSVSGLSKTMPGMMNKKMPATQTGMSKMMKK